MYHTCGASTRPGLNLDDVGDVNETVRKEGQVRGDKSPSSYTTGEWPHDAVPEPDAPLPVYYSLALARTLDGLCDRRGYSHRALSLAAGIASNAVGRIVRGEVYPDLATLARLEGAAKEPIYPHGLYLDVRQPGPGPTDSTEPARENAPGSH